MRGGLKPYGDDAGSFESEVKRLVSGDLDAWLRVNAVKYGYEYKFLKGRS